MGTGGLPCLEWMGQRSCSRLSWEDSFPLLLLATQGPSSHTPRSLPMRELLTFVLLSTAAALGTAQQVPVIEVDGAPFFSWHEYTHSEIFQKAGLRCGYKSQGQGAGSFLGGGGDCAYNFTSIESQYDPGDTIVIPVVFHVIRHTNGAGNVTTARINQQIDILNQDFGALPGSNGANGTDSGIRFQLATVDPLGMPTTGITVSTNNTWYFDGGSYWNSLAWDTSRYLNIYTNSPGAGTLGYVPDIPQGGLVGTPEDRVVLLWSTVGFNAPIGPPYNYGRTATHEVGHYLGLEHVFDGGCGTSSCYSTGDHICDTHPQNSPVLGCSNPTSCGSPSNFRNYLDYSDDLCMWEFTPEQINRMRCTLEHWRPLLGASGGTPGDAVSINVDIGANTTYPVPGSGYGGAAGQPGTWNAASAAGGATALDAVDGTSSGVSLSVAGGNGDFAFNNAATTGNVQNLLDDLQDSGSSTWTFSNIGEGDYEVYLYSFAPDNPAFESDLTVLGGAAGTQRCGGGAWAGTWVEGTHYVVDQVTVGGNGFLSITVAPVGANPSSLNGIQLVALGDGDDPGTLICFGDGSAGQFCPCLNQGAAGEGCQNSTGAGAALTPSGSSNWAADDLSLTLFPVPTNQFGLVFMGTNSLSPPALFGDGLRCVGGNVCRLGVQNSGVFGAIVVGPGLIGNSVGTACPILAGETWYFQGWYRDPGGPCNTGFNLSNAVEVTF